VDTVTGNDVLLALVVVTALGFDFTNGFHDTGNAMATSIATGALPPRVAVAISGVLNLVGAFLSFTVAATIASGLVQTTWSPSPWSSPAWSAASCGTWPPGTSASRRAPRTP
jgi:phosphate/sulfate permease